MRDAASGFNQASTEAQSVLRRADTLLAAVDANKVNTAVNDITQASADARGAIASAREVVDGVADRRDEINDAIRDFTEQERADFLHREPTKLKIAGINMTYEGLVPRVRRSFLQKDREAMQPHIRAFVDRAVTFTTCPACDGTRLSQEGQQAC